MNIRFCVCAALVILSLQLSAQSVGGSWYGVGQVKKVGEHNSYLSELVLKQKGNKVTGVFSYFFRNFTVETRFTGTYNPRTRILHLNSHPVLNFQATSTNGADCPMEGWFTLRVSRAETVLSGAFTPMKDYRLTCPIITVKFNKELRPEPKDPEPIDIADNTEDALPAPAAEEKTKVDPFTKNVEELNKRAFEASPVIDVDADSLKVTLYDNGEVDNDTISVFYNRHLVAEKRMLTASGFTFTVPLDTAINEIAMYAENLGRLPPNTALAVIYAGEQRFELALSSNFITNSTIRFRRKVKAKDRKNVN